MKIVILEGDAVNPGDLSWECLAPFGEVVIYPYSLPQDAAKRIGDADTVIMNKVPITSEVMDACPNLRLVCLAATGYNAVDCDAAKKRGITVCNVPAYSTNSVAQFTFSLLLELCNRVGYHDDFVHSGGWSKCKSFCYWGTPQMELAGKTIGIIGFGNIGKAVARIAKAFQMNVLVYNRSRCLEGEALGTYVDLNTLLQKSDIVTLHCPLTAQTEHIINAQTLFQMKDGAFLINTARGGLVVENDLKETLESGKLQGAAVDVVSVEPIKEDNPLLQAPNCIITPHMAWTPVESRQRVIDCITTNIQKYIENDPVNVVN